MEDITGKVDEVKTSTFKSAKTGRDIPKYEVVIAGMSYSAIGAPPTCVKGDVVTLKLVQNGIFVNISDVLKNGVSVLPARAAFGASGAATAKAQLIVAATMIACHHSAYAKTSVTVDDVRSILPALQSL